MYFRVFSVLYMYSCLKGVLIESSTFIKNKAKNEGGGKASMTSLFYHFLFVFLKFKTLKLFGV